MNASAELRRAETGDAQVAARRRDRCESAAKARTAAVERSEGLAGEGVLLATAVGTVCWAVVGLTAYQIARWLVG